MPDTLPNESSEKIKYLILGCGSIGYNIVEELFRETDEVLIIDHDEKRVEDLMDQKYSAISRELTDPALFKGLPVPEVIFIVSNDKDGNLAAVKTVKKEFPQTYVIARALDHVSYSQLGKAGADIVLYPQEVFAQSAIHHVRMLHSSRLARKLFDILSSWEGTLGIVTHTNPDPDAISSAMALCAIGNMASGGKLDCRILYDGKIGHQENRAFVNLLDIQMERVTPEIMEECDYLALVDSCSPGCNNVLNTGTHVDIVIDHHKTSECLNNSAFVDVRPGMGATASIMTQYLQELDMPVDKKVATALLYGIRADTKGFRRNTTPQDLNYAAFLQPLTDSELLDKIISPSMSQETLGVLGNAIKNRRIISGYLFSNVGYIRNRDALPQAADLLIQLEGVNTALVYGINDKNIIMSARNKDVRLHIGKVMDEAFSEMGEAGGHASMAAAVIPLKYFNMVKNKEELLALVIDPILKKFMDLVDLDEEEINEI
ncbi:MAG: DHH family phosphoesterase [Euryarchaeota archaeon]|nr:DHH family phosphoesterase [Euryarchaeota archaeon]